MRGHGIEGRRRTEEALRRSAEVEPRLRARIQDETAVMRNLAGDYDGARELWLAALEAYEAIGDDLEIGRMLSQLGSCEVSAGDPLAAIGYLEATPEKLPGEEFIRLIALGNLAQAYEQTGELERAWETALHVLEAQRGIGDRDGVAYMSFTLASVALAQDELAESHRRLVECLTVAAEVGFVELTGYALGVAAALALELDAEDEAAHLLGASRDLRPDRRLARRLRDCAADRPRRLSRRAARRRRRGDRARQDDRVEAAVALALDLGSRIPA